MAGVDQSGDRKTGTQAIERAIAILRLFAEGDQPLTLTEVARSRGLATATTHRILASLVRERLLAYDATAERYSIGADSVFLFAAAARRYGVTAARVELDGLVAATRETATLGLIDGSDLVIVLQSESDLPLRFLRPVGTRVPIHVSAMGKAILAASATDLDRCVEALGDLHRFTEHTITDRPRLVADIESARRRGWASNDAEHYHGVRAIAVPILSSDSRARAAVGVQGPIDRLTDARLDDVVAALQASAQRIGQHLEITL